MTEDDKVPGAWAHPDGRLFMLALFGLACLFAALITPEARSLLAVIGLVLVAIGTAGMLLSQYRRRKRGP